MIETNPTIIFFAINYSTLPTRLIFRNPKKQPQISLPYFSSYKTKSYRYYNSLISKERGEKYFSCLLLGSIGDLFFSWADLLEIRAQTFNILRLIHKHKHKIKSYYIKNSKDEYIQISWGYDPFGQCSCFASQDPHH